MNKAVLEGLLFVVGEDGLTFEQIEDVLDITEEEAKNKVYTGGLKIYTTMDSDAQKIAVTEFEDSSNLPGVTGVRKDADGNIYDYAYGLNWSGVIKDWRTEKYAPKRR